MVQYRKRILYYLNYVQKPTRFLNFNFSRNKFWVLDMKFWKTHVFQQEFCIFLSPVKEVMAQNFGSIGLYMGTNL